MVKFVAALMGAFGLVMLVSALLEARFVLMARPAQAVVVRHVAREGSSVRSETVKLSGRAPESRIVSDRYVGQAAVLQFEVGGRKVEFEGQVHGVDSPYPVGSRLEIVYDPWNLEHAVVADEAPGWAGVLGGAFFGSIVAGGGLLAMIAFGGWKRYFPNFRLG